MSECRVWPPRQAKPRLKQHPQIDSDFTSRYKLNIDHLRESGGSGGEKRRQCPSPILSVPFQFVDTGNIPGQSNMAP